MKKDRKYLLGASLTASLTSAAIVSRGAGFDLPDLDAFATGRGMAFVATADNPSAIYYNPAGITQIPGSNLRGGVYGIYIDPSYKSAATGGNYDNRDKLNAITQMYYTYQCKDTPFTFGVGMYSPFGLALNWPTDTGFRTVTGGIESSLTYLTFNPVVGIKLGPNLSVGGGISANYAYAHIKQGLPSPPFAPNNTFEFKGDGWTVGYNLGALWQPIEQLSFGTTFRSSTTVDLDGHTDASIGGTGYEGKAHAQFTFPLEALFGVSYRPTPKWNLEFDADYMDWGALQSITIDQTKTIALPKNIPVALDWQSSWYFEWGGTRYFDNHWHLSGGFIYSEDSIPTSNYTPAAGDMDRYFLSTGLGYKGKRLDVDLAYQFGFSPPFRVNNSPAQVEDGKYYWCSHAIALSAEWHF